MGLNKVELHPSGPQAKRTRLPITRAVRDDAVCYRKNGREIRATQEIERLNALAIPPAWTGVEIAQSPAAKVLARGIDAAGRTQILYHPAFRKRQDRKKFARVIRFGAALPKLRARIDKDLRSKRLTRDRVVACAIRLIDLQYLRVGNTEYALRHRNYGVTTLRRTHVEVNGPAVELDFPAKGGKRFRRRVEDPRVTRVLARLLELPGAEVFRFFEEDDGIAREVRSSHVNAYVKRAMGEEFSAKDFRTWGGTLLAVTALLAADDEAFATESGRAALARDIVRATAEQLGNTPAVAKSSYIDPRVFGAVEHPALVSRIKQRKSRMRARRYLGVEEQCVLTLLPLVESQREKVRKRTKTSTRRLRA